MANNNKLTMCMVKSSYNRQSKTFIDILNPINPKINYYDDIFKSSEVTLTYKSMDSSVPTKFIMTDGSIPFKEHTKLSSYMNNSKLSIFINGELDAEIDSTTTCREIFFSQFLSYSTNNRNPTYFVISNIPVTDVTIDNINILLSCARHVIDLNSYLENYKYGSPNHEDFFTISDEYFIGGDKYVSLVSCCNYFRSNNIFAALVINLLLLLLRDYSSTPIKTFIRSDFNMGKNYDLEVKYRIFKDILNYNSYVIKYLTNIFPYYTFYTLVVGIESFMNSIINVDFRNYGKKVRLSLSNNVIPALLLAYYSGVRNIKRFKINDDMGLATKTFLNQMQNLFTEVIKIASDLNDKLGDHHEKEFFDFE